MPSEAIGNYIQQTANKNGTLRYDVDSVKGVSIEKNSLKQKLKWTVYH